MMTSIPIIRPAHCMSAWAMVAWVIFAPCRDVRAEPAEGAPPADVLDLARRYLGAAPADFPALERQLAEYRGDWAPVIAHLADAEPRAWEQPTPSRAAQEFTRPALRGKYPESRLFFHVPANYDAAQPSSMLMRL